MEHTPSPIVETQMLIRKPADVVFKAFVDPDITKNFWFTNASGCLETGKTVTWEWEMYKAKIDVLVKKMVPLELIVIEWGHPATTVEFNFKTLGAEKTYVIIKNYGFVQSGIELINTIIDVTGGFTTVLDGLKAYLEYNINLRLVNDKFLKA